MCHTTCAHSIADCQTRSNNCSCQTGGCKSYASHGSPDGARVLGRLAAQKGNQHAVVLVVRSHADQVMGREVLQINTTGLCSGGILSSDAFDIMCSGAACQNRFKLKVLPRQAASPGWLQVWAARALSILYRDVLYDHKAHVHPWVHTWVFLLDI